MIIPVDSFPDGNYRLGLVLNDQKKNLLWQSQYKVVVQNPALLTRGDFEEKIAQVEYISRRSEFDSLKKAGPEERDSLWRVFWKSRDPTPDTDKNEYRDTHYEKINYANSSFGSSIRPGWRTDMGRIYIKYGQPDEIEKHPFEIDSPPYEVWYFYQEGLKIIFLDRHGFGDYRIVYANKEI
ncbi:MAG: GWxTD domain-containing protein [Candidatus Edwardsbacteria bacterium]|nr:GWxTD domain-containing protein [Candidatus Edwardsbacteria bacterium]MBU1576672.1 GWxTD domain-containing protein [Candidatus Edwardsbacteria bacterium]MBU2464200.1 GWxTD domain-containing protein [Candidatus Edwardsbacteria bacterium]MBU2594500.1 GWxTD domain-containing protein [Candidatus Edwardsbacteria bacterium]